MTPGGDPSGLARPEEESTVSFEDSDVVRSAVRVEGFRDDEFNYQLIRAMGVADYGGSSVGECLAVVSEITDGSPQSWTSGFERLAQRVESQGRMCLEEGRKVSGRDHLLRASTYYRTAEYYGGAAGTDRADGAVASSQMCFQEATALIDPPVESLSIPFDGGVLPGYLVRPTGSVASNGPRPTVAAVLDVVVGHPDVDGDRLALCGQSFGSYFAARSAATDLRVSALVANPPVVDMGRYMEAWVGTDIYRMNRDIRPEDVTGVPEDLMPRQMQWGIEAICTRFGVPSFHAWREAMDSYRLGDLASAITCPVLALVGEREGAEPIAQFEALIAAVTGPVTSRVFGPADGASAHCQSDNLRLSAQVTFDWLDAQLA